MSAYPFLFVFMLQAYESRFPIQYEYVLYAYAHAHSNPKCACSTDMRIEFETFMLFAKVVFSCVPILPIPLVMLNGGERKLAK